jgi:transposase
MKNADKNLQLLMDILKPLTGLQLMKQIVCVTLILFDVDEKTIIERLGVSYNTVMKYSRLIKADKLHELFADRRYRPRSELEDYRDKIIEALDKNPARTLREAALIIEQTTGLKRSIPQVRDFLKKRI